MERGSVTPRGSGVSIVRMGPEHVREVLAIERYSFSTPWSEPSFYIELHSPAARLYAALDEGAVAGYICTRQVLDEGHIQNLAVHPDMRGRGIAKAIVGKAVEEFGANGCKHIYLEVRASNLAAIRLYEGFGFKPAGTRKGYYIAPLEDALIMQLEL